MKSFARAGFAAGPCLLKDTLQLSAFSGNNFFLGHAAMLVNEGLPNFIPLTLRKNSLRDKTVAILGMAFKADTDDNRESLSYKLRKMLIAGGEAGRVHAIPMCPTTTSFRWTKPYRGPTSSSSARLIAFIGT